MRGARALLAGTAAAAGVLITASAASGAVGGLSYEGCIAGEDSVTDPCTLIADAAANGSNSGLNGVESVTVSRDGRWVYAAARLDDSIARFKRSGSGSLAYKGCVSGDINAACSPVPGATADGAASGLDDVRALVISRDGEWAYAAVANDDAIARFARDPRTGRLSFRDCITSAAESGPSGSGACAETSSVTALGANSGLDHPKSLILSGDGKSLYVAATNDAAIARFKRDTGDGKLAYKDCITGETESGATGSEACESLDAAGTQGDDSGLDDPRGLELARNGRTLVGVSSDDDALFVFDRDPGNGRLAFETCLAGEAASVATGACDSLGATTDGVDSGLDDLRSLALSRDGASLYVVSRFDSAIYQIPLSASGGAPRCLSADVDAAGDDPCASIGTPSASGQNTGFASPESVVVSRDGRSVYVSSAQGAAVTRFRRDRDTGQLTHLGCITGEEGSGPSGSGACSEIASATTGGTDSGLELPQFMILSADDRSLYVSAGQDDAVATFDRDR